MIFGAGAAGVAIANLLLAMGVSSITVLDSQGILHPDRIDMNSVKAELAQRTNPAGLTGGMIEALDKTDVFIGVSAGVVPEEIIATMAPEAIVFALSNPDPEIHPDVAAKHAAVVATGLTTQSSWFRTSMALAHRPRSCPTSWPKSPRQPGKPSAGPLDTRAVSQLTAHCVPLY